jgi:hypothetical protein
VALTATENVGNGNVHDPDGRQVVLLSAGAALADATTNPTASPVGALDLVFNGSTWDRLRTPNVFKTLNAVSIATEATIWTPAAGKKFRLMGGLISVGTAAANVLIKDNTAGTTIAILPKTAVDVAFTFVLGNGVLSAAANNVLTATGVATTTISGVVWGTEE